MAPVVPFIPLIAAGVGAAGAVTAAGLGLKAARTNSKVKPTLNPNSPQPLNSSPLIQDPAISDDKARLKGVLPIATGPLGDTTSPSLNRSKLLGN